MAKRIFMNLVGAQGTGKTTILNKLEKFEKITEVVRKLSKSGIKINEYGDDDGQRHIFNTYNEIFDRLDNRKNWVSDRGLFDVFAYTKYLYNHGNVSEDLYNEQYNRLINWSLTNKDVVIAYFPIEFDVVNDGVRSLDENFRKEIDENIKWILNECNVKYYVIEGSIEERLELINAIIEFNK